jgi:cell shape-determining protein MreD
MLKIELQKIGFVVVVVLMQVSFFSGLGLPFSQLNFVLACLLFWGFLSDFRGALIYGLLAGALLENYSALPFGAAMLSLLIPLALADKVFSSALTNRSYYTILILCLLVTFFCQLILFLFVGVSFYAENDALFPAFVRQMFLANSLYAAVMNSAFISVLYFVFSMMTRQFSEVFSDDWRE